MIFDREWSMHICNICNIFIWCLVYSQNIYRMIIIRFVHDMMMIFVCGRNGQLTEVSCYNKLHQKATIVFLFIYIFHNYFYCGFLFLFGYDDEHILELSEFLQWGVNIFFNCNLTLFVTRRSFLSLYLKLFCSPMKTPTSNA